MNFIPAVSIAGPCCHCALQENANEVTPLFDKARLSN
jgi:hypothetical protein